jgi:PQQ-like domain
VPDVLIELGEDWAAPAPPPPRPRDPRRTRWAWLLALALLPALATGGSARVRSAFREVASVPAAVGQTFAVTAGAIDVLEASTVDGSTVTSYPLAGGPRRWRVPVPGPVNNLLPVVRSGVLLAEYLPATAPGQPDPFLAALDAATGRLLWSTRGARLVDVRPDLHLAVLSLGGPRAATRVLGVDLRTGRSIWAVPVARPGAPWAIVAGVGAAGDGSSRVMLLVGDRVTLLAEATGVALATREVGIPSADARRDARAPRLYVLGNQGIVAYEDNFRTVFAAYDLAALAPRWRVTMRTETGFLAACGPLLCAGTGVLATCFPVRCSAIDSFLYGLDPGTAAVRWVSRGWSHTGTQIATRVIAFNREMPGSLEARDAVIDPVTGRVVLDLGLWYPVGAALGTTTVLVSRRDDSYHSWLALLQREGGTLRPLGRLPVAGEACQSMPVYLVCPTLDGRLTVWRYAF